MDIVPIKPTFVYDNGVWNLNIDQIPVPDYFKVVEKKALYIPPGEYGGNHSHSRREIFISANSGLFMVWQDTDGVKHEVEMFGGELQMFIVHPHTPHAVVNRSNEPLLLLELADDVLSEVVSANLI